jgi:hypothetical protein
MNEVRRWSLRKRIAVAAGIAVILVVAKPVSFGPACWLADRGILSDAGVAYTFESQVRLAWAGPTIMKTPLSWYANVGARDPRILQRMLVPLNCGRLTFIDEEDLDVSPLGGTPDATPKSN